MSLRSISNKLFLPGIAVLGLVASLWAGHLQFRNAEPPISHLVRTAVALGSTQFAIADFDGDLQPDLALIRVARDSSPTAQYSRHLNFTSDPNPAISILAPPACLQSTPPHMN